MKRRIVMEVDDVVWKEHAEARYSRGALVRVGAFLCNLLGPMTHAGQRGFAATHLKQYGVVLISDEQID